MKMSIYRHPASSSSKSGISEVERPTSGTTGGISNLVIFILREFSCLTINYILFIIWHLIFQYRSYVFYYARLVGSTLRFCTV